MWSFITGLVVGPLFVGPTLKALWTTVSPYARDLVDIVADALCTRRPKARPLNIPVYQRFPFNSAELDEAIMPPVPPVPTVPATPQAVPAVPPNEPVGFEFDDMPPLISLSDM